MEGRMETAVRDGERAEGMACANAQEGDGMQGDQDGGQSSGSRTRAGEAGRPALSSKCPVGVKEGEPNTHCLARRSFPLNP